MLPDAALGDLRRGPKDCINTGILQAMASGIPPVTAALEPDSGIPVLILYTHTPYTVYHAPYRLHPVFFTILGFESFCICGSGGLCLKGTASNPADAGCAGPCFRGPLRSTLPKPWGSKWPKVGYDLHIWSLREGAISNLIFHFAGTVVPQSHTDKSYEHGPSSLHEA